jgi:predicted HTH domain antitoxin
MQQLDNPEQLTKESLAVELYRQHKLTLHQVGKLLGLSRYEVDGLLKRHGVMLEITADEVRQEADALYRARTRC